MSFWSAFTGGSAKKQAAATLAYNRGQQQAGRDNTMGFARDAYTSATGRLQPFEQGGQRAQTALTGIMGLDGQPARRTALAAYTGNNPFLAGDMDEATRAIARRSAAQGDTGGLNALAQQRVTREMGSADYNNYVNRLMNMAGQGQGAAGALAGIDQNYGSQRIGIEDRFRGGNIAAQNQYSQDYNAANQSGAQNFLSAAGTLASLAMAPITGGLSLGGMAGSLAGSLAGKALSSGLSAATGGYNAGAMSGLGGALASRNYGNVGQSTVGPGGLPQLGGVNFFRR